MKKLFYILALTVLMGTVPLSAEVYLLGRPIGAGKGSAVSSFLGGNTSPLHVEEVRSNGKSFFLEIYKSQNSLQEIYGRLKKLSDKTTTVVSNGKLVRCKNLLDSKKVEHILFADSGDEVIVFRILLPQNFSAGKQLHEQLPPLPGGARSELVLELPARNGVFGLFNNAFGTAQGNLRAALSNLSDEWYINGDESLMPNGRGAMLTGKKKGILLVSFSDDGTGFFYLKK